jgi:hypothetical protein
MAAYRLYFVGANGHFADVEVLDCRDDDAAIKASKQHADGRAMELWQHERMVATFPAQPHDGPPPPFAPGRA